MTTVRLGVLKRKAEEAAKRERRSLSDFIRVALEDRIARGAAA